MLPLHHGTAVQILCNAFLALSLSFVCITRCADAMYSHSFYGKTYSISYHKITVDAARENCKSDGGYLVDIRSSEEVEHLVAIIREHYPTDTESKFIIGTRRISDQNWRYENNDRTIYTNWTPGMPVNGGSCVYMSGSGINGRWGNMNCNDEHYHICTKIPESPTFWYPFYGKVYNVPIRAKDEVKGVNGARDKCNTLVGTLADMHSEEELQHVKTIIYSIGYINAIWMWWFAIGGRKTDGNWKHEDGSPMTFTRWARGEPGNRTCVHLQLFNNKDDPNPDKITLSDKKIYFSNACNYDAMFHYVCSSTSDMFLDMPNEFTEGSVATWKCISYVPASTDNMEFMVRTTEDETVQILHGNNASISRKTLHQTKVIEVRLEYEYNPRREHNDLSVVCQVHVGARIILSAKYKMTIYFPPNKIIVLGFENVMDNRNQSILDAMYTFESRSESINFSTDESYPASNIDITFIETQRIKIFSTNRSTNDNYPAYVTSAICTFTPLRRHNGHLLHVRLQNKKFPNLNITKKIPIVVYFRPTKINISITPLLIEGLLETINITSDESFPHSNIDIDFNPRQTPPITKFFHDNIGENYTGYMLRAEYGFRVSREDNGKLFRVALKNAKFSTLNLTQVRSLVVHFASLGTNLVFNSSWYREGQIIMATCDDGSAYPYSEIEFHNVKDIIILSNTTSQHQTSGVNYTSTSTRRTITFFASTTLSNKRITCLAKHATMDKVRIAHMSIPIYYMRNLQTANIVLDRPGRANVSIKAFPRELFFVIIDSLNRTQAIGDVVVDKHNNYFSVPVSNQLNGGNYTIVVRNNYGMSARIGLTYTHIAQTTALSNSKTAIAQIIGYVCGIVVLIVSAFAVGILLGKRRDRLCCRAKNHPTSTIGLNSNTNTTATCSTDNMTNDKNSIGDVLSEPYDEIEPTDVPLEPYDEVGSMVVLPGPYDENGNTILLPAPYDEDGSTIVTPAPCDEIGNTILLPVPYDEDGSSIVAPAPYEEIGNTFVLPVPYDENGGAIVAPVPYDEIGSTVVLPVPHDENSSTIGVPVPYDEIGSTVVLPVPYDENGSTVVPPMPYYEIGSIVVLPEPYDELEEPYTEINDAT